MPENKYKPIPELSPEWIANFWTYVEKRGPEECWPWNGNTNWSGYGLISINRKPYRSTRIMIFLTTGKDPGELMAVHTCENNPTFIGHHCTNPGHLKAGTHRENMDYVIGRDCPDRSNPGEVNGNAEFTEPEVVDVLKRLEDGETVVSIAAFYGRTAGMVSHIKTGRNWAHLGGTRTKDKCGGYKLTAEQKAEIFRLRECGLSQQKISNRLGGIINQSMVSKILAKGQ